MNPHCADLEWAWCHRAGCDLSPIMEAPERLMAAGHQLNEAAAYLDGNVETRNFGAELRNIRLNLLDYLDTFKYRLAEHERCNRHMLQFPHGKPTDARPDPDPSPSAS